MWLFHPILNLKSQFCFKKLLYFWLLKIWLFGNFNLSLHESKCYGYTIFLVAFWLGAHTPFLCDRCILLSLQKLPTFSGVCCKTLGCTHVHTPFFLVKWEGVFKWCNPKIQVLIIIGFLVLNVQKSFRKIHCICVVVVWWGTGKCLMHALTSTWYPHGCHHYLYWTIKKFRNESDKQESLTWVHLVLTGTVWFSLEAFVVLFHNWFFGEGIEIMQVVLSSRFA